MFKRSTLTACVIAIIALLFATPILASEADLVIPELNADQKNLFNIGFFVCFLGMAFGLMMYKKVKALPSHKSMLDVAEIIFQTCSTYLIQQGKLLLILFAFHRGMYFLLLSAFLSHMSTGNVLLILCMDGRRYPRVLRCGLVRYQDEHPGQQPHGLCFA